MKFTGLIVILLLLAISSFVSAQTDAPKRVNGISIWSDSIPREAGDYAFVEKTNANWLSFHPYGVVSTDSGGVQFNRNDIWECSSYDNLIKNIAIAKNLGYYVFLKPHIIVKFSKPGAWAGNLKLGSEDNWNAFEKDYCNQVIRLAQIADSMKVELFSLGTELGNFPQERSKAWSNLIDSVRSVFNGGLTYCANFDAYEDYSFWDRMDLIALDAYFTVDHSRKTNLDKCREGWIPIAKKLKAFSKKYDKMLLFSEFGYASNDYCGLTPFTRHGYKVNLVAQANAYRAVFDTFWHEPWFAGGFSWLWRFDNDQPENYDNNTYSPQNKPAAGIIAKTYLKYK